MRKFLFASLAVLIGFQLTGPVNSMAALPAPVAPPSALNIHVKFAESDGFTMRGDQFVSTNGRNTDALNAVLTSKTVAKKTRLFTSSPTAISTLRAEAFSRGETSIPDLDSYYRLTVQPDTDIKALLTTLRKTPGVVEAYAEPLAAPSPVSPSYTGLQTYFNAAPSGMGVTAGNTHPGAKGENVRIADIEYSWNTSHEDLSDARQTDTFIPNGTPSDPFSDNNHGTAVTGIVSGDSNTFGVKGIVPNAKLHLVNVNNVERGWDGPNAILAATLALSAGDVLLIEQQTSAFAGHGYVPFEWIPANYDAIKLASAKGIIVVEAAGNGSENLDDPIYGPSFPNGKADSGAIIVGAGAACVGNVKLSRKAFSNYGSRVNVQGFGECVATSGYGALNFTAGPNAWYTDSFSGTSSASALVAAVAAAVSSAYEQQKGVPPTPAQVRTMLAATGTPQNKSTDPGNIGPLPNLDAAIKSFSADTTAPTAPRSLTARINRQKKVVVAWKASTDNSGTITYRIFRNGKQIATTKSLSYTDSSVKPKTTYSYKIQAVDPSGNASAFSNKVSIKTP